jgi:hypothetical protein
VMRGLSNPGHPAVALLLSTPQEREVFGRGESVVKSRWTL